MLVSSKSGVAADQRSCGSRTIAAPFGQPDRVALVPVSQSIGFVDDQDAGRMPPQIPRRTRGDNFQRAAGEAFRQ